MDCSICFGHFHLKCLNNITANDSLYLNRHHDVWFCTHCMKDNLPFNHYDDNDTFYQSLITFFSNAHERLIARLSNLVYNPLEMDDSDLSPIADYDPDTHYFNDSNSVHNLTSCHYLLEDTFNSKCETEKITSNEFSIIHFNIRSIQKNLQEFDNFLHNLNHSFSVIGFSETWLNQSNSSLYNLNGYNGTHACRNSKKGGGVSIFVKENLDFLERSDLSTFNDIYESIFIEITNNQSLTGKNTIIGVIYRPPGTDVSAFTLSLDDIISKVASENKELFLMGDFNINLLNHDRHTQTSEFLDSMYSQSLFPLITKPTRVYRETATLIDNIYTKNILDNRYHCGIFVTDITDHYPVFCICSNVSTDKNTDLIKFRNLGPANLNLFCDKISQINWVPILNGNNCQQAYSQFHDTITGIYNDCFPLKMTRKKYENRKPWLTIGLKESIKHKNKLFLIQKRNPTNENITFYKQYRNKLQSLIRNLEREHYKMLFEQNKNNLKKSWSIIKNLINKNAKKSTRSSFKISGRVVKNPEIISNSFNEFYINIGKNLAAKIPSNDISPTSYIKDRNEHSMYLQPTDTTEISHIIKNLKESSAGYDEIQAKVVKASLLYLIEPLKNLINLSLSEGIFPNELKIAKVIPIYKSGDPMLVQNYRPISILPLFSKIFERVVASRITSFITQHNILYKYQFGFRANHNTSLALILLTDEIYSAFNNNDSIVGLFLDFQKAFDTLHHGILLEKLNKMGIRGKANDWVKSYLQNRKQFVSFNNHYSRKSNISWGVPQGSILGPLLFLLYINDIAEVCPEILPILYADDTNLFFRGKNINNVINEMNTKLVDIVKWLNSNKLSLNINKTTYIVFSQIRRIRSAEYNILINGSKIKKVENVKFLGVYIDNKMNWEKHIAHIKAKIAKGIGIIYKLKRYFDYKTLVSLYYNFVYPYIIYGLEIWGTASKTQISSIHLLQKKVIRIIKSVPTRTSCDGLFKDLKILTIQKLFHFQVAIFMYKVTYKQVPPTFINMFTINETVHDHDTRNSQAYRIPTLHLTISQRGIRYIGVHYWNDKVNQEILPCSIAVFKKSMKKTLINETSTI